LQGLTDLLSQLDPRPDIRGRQFERICAWYLGSAPEYRRRFRKVWLWKDWPGAWAPDAGIDLVAEEHGGDLWAIQAKVYDPNSAIKKADLDSFLSESSRPGFAYRLLIATTDRLGPTARRTLDDQREPVGYLLRSQLELARAAWPGSPEGLRPRRPAPKKPFPHVREAVRATVKGFERSDRGQLLMACGTGKTLAAMWIAERLESKRTLVLVPSLSLLAQTLREWSANASKPFDYLAVCSDASVAGEDDFVEHTSELGLPVTTDPDLIAAFLRRRGRRVVFATYQSSPQIAAAYSGRVPAFDLAAADEAHRCAGRVGSEFTTILDADQIRSKRRLFMTATPRYYTSRVRREAGVLEVEVASMDDEAAFGPVLHHLSFGEGIERDLLSDYQVVVVGVDDETYRTYAERGELVTRDGKDTDARTLAGQIGLAKSMRKYKLRRIVSFHGRIKAAREFSTELPDVIAWMPPRARPEGALWSSHVSGAMTSGRRDRLLLRFRDLAPNERGLLSNARCLGEGVDVPSIDGVAFIDPRRSTIDIVQALGRAIRKSPEKKVGTIVLPVFISDDEDAERVLDESAFKHVWDVLKALRAHDEVLGEELDELRRRLGALRAPPKRPGKIKLDVPSAKVGPEFAKAFDVRLVEQTTATWEFFFGLLERFVEREGHARVPIRWRENGYRLGQWVVIQRRRAMDHQRERRLEALPGWAWDAQEAAWEEGFAHLLKFVEREGHARVPKEWRENGFRLGQWVEMQRGRRLKKLDPKRQVRLEALPQWAWDTKKAAWEEGFEHLVRFVEREGHARVPQAWREQGFRLGQWVAVQRRMRGRRIRDPQRDARLAAIPGWAWDAQEAAWEEGFAHLLKFVEREGHARVPRGWGENGYRLGQWVIVQRSRRKTLDQQQQARLEALPGWTWSLKDENWEEGFAHLVRFVEREGHARVPGAWTEQGFPLGVWVRNLRARPERLDQQRQARLEALPGWAWDKWEAAWEKGFAHLVRFVEREGHIRIPGGHRENGFRLRAWFDKQRRDRRLGRLAEERAQRLEALPGWAWGVSER
jgi:superfamily II DNA or RNA helicase